MSYGIITYFRINDYKRFLERTLMKLIKVVIKVIWKVVQHPMRDENQLHAANVELIALDDAEIKYS